MLRRIKRPRRGRRPGTGKIVFRTQLEYHDHLDEIGNCWSMGYYACFKQIHEDRINHLFGWVVRGSQVNSLRGYATVVEVANDGSGELRIKLNSTGDLLWVHRNDVERRDD
jgi:hypothetical protein